MKRFSILLLALVCVGCVPQIRMAWVRTDGKPLDAKIDPKFQSTLAQCRADAYVSASHVPGAAYPDLFVVAAAERNRAETRVAVAFACMSRAGYVWVRVTDASQ
jgi:hypothetical protein